MVDTSKFCSFSNKIVYTGVFMLAVAPAFLAFTLPLADLDSLYEYRLPIGQASVAVTLMLLLASLFAMCCQGCIAVMHLLVTTSTLACAAFLLWLPEIDWSMKQTICEWLGDEACP